MELRSGHRLNPPPPSVPFRCRRWRFRSEGGRVDRISALPDDLLLQVLVLLRCARTSALTSAVSRWWRGLWRHLNELSFREIAPDTLEAALGQVTHPAISLLEIDIPEEHRDKIDPARISTLLRMAARLAPTALIFTACGHRKGSSIPIEVPVFHRATSIKLKVYALDVERNFGQELASLPSFSVLQLSLVTRGHIFGLLLLNLLGICTVIQKLEVSIDKVTFRQVCPSNCPCEQTQNWRSETISLTALEEVEIKGFEGTGDEIDVLKLLFRCTPLMKTMTITIPPMVLPTSRGCKKTYKILRENPSVKCRVYSSGGEQVLYP